LFKFLLLFALSGCFTACSLFQKQPQSLSTLTGLEEALYAVKAWRMEGRIGVQLANDAWQANLFWEHESDQDRLLITGPLSQGMLSIVLRKNLIYLNEGKGQSELSRDPESLLKERLGFVVPLTGLRYWVLGLPDPSAPFTPAYDETGVLKGFRQWEWSLEWDRWMSVGTLRIPQKILIQGHEVKLKLFADRWNIKS
jgi:outer membrane lipoprotein LolB